MLCSIIDLSVVQMHLRIRLNTFENRPRNVLELFGESCAILIYKMALIDESCVVLIYKMALLDFGMALLNSGIALLDFGNFLTTCGKIAEIQKCNFVNQHGT